MFNQGWRSGGSSGGGGGTGRGYSNLGKSYHAVPSAKPANPNPFSHTQYMEAMLKRHRTEAEYFEADSDEEEDKALMRKREDSDSEEDPLDAFMAGINEDLAKQKAASKKSSSEDKKKAVRQDIEELDDQESFFKYMEENPNAGVPMYDADDILEYDADGNPIIPERSKFIDPLPPINHAEIKYEAFVKNFYEEHRDIAALKYPEVLELRKKFGIRVSGFDPPRPVSSFGHFGFDEQLMHYIRKSEYSQPTPIQAQGVPIALSGRDIIGIAKTGSGKTAAFVWPMLVHIMDQRAVKTTEGPIGLICAPTRELAQQIYVEVKRFGKAYDIKAVCAYGGGNMWEQQRACQEGPEVIVCTPGRLIDLVKKKSTNLQRVTFLVFDEADRMFDMGFEPQVRSIANHVRPDRQTLLFSATFRKKVERLARDILTDPIRVVQGDAGEANEDVKQIVQVFRDDKAPESKWKWLTGELVRFTTLGSVLIFVTKKLNAEELANNLCQQDFNVGLLHGDMDQSSRNSVITDFKRKVIPVMVATDVAARGLDIPSVKIVVNYDVARDIDTHTHRIGRTGRAGEKGTAYTLVTAKDIYFAGDLVRNLEGANQTVSQSLLDLAMQNPRFRKTRSCHGAKGKVGGGSGLGYGKERSKAKDRPGLGSSGKDDQGGKTGPTLGPLGGGFAAADPSEMEGSRLASMRNTFKAQYQRHFQKASSSSTSNTFSAENTGNYAMPPKNPASSGLSHHHHHHHHHSLAESGLSLKVPGNLKAPPTSHTKGILSTFVPPEAKDSKPQTVAPIAPPSRKSKWDVGGPKSPEPARRNSGEGPGRKPEGSRWDSTPRRESEDGTSSQDKSELSSPTGHLDSHGYWQLGGVAPSAGVSQHAQDGRSAALEEALKRAHQVDEMVAEKPKKRKSRWDI
ncbi:ATP-dependent RNA helicase DDX42-like [Acanthaster planci]|uniref:ATP-dependent RNA helicase DDX42 n=1 Tax=Acanthaster planci TaxID=133434 RepID=A0A8B7XI69_ACAPL|nr:ATP-dependent RNA helicase DDX42-like [Acanthaster planci]XP_022079916.1 ATP-dependent RNA helicase DDX42-like [Acanthaster planci]XP_022079917.1 ATP-dependent RNA helicase DDX42-like [Acanthaster planci]XP_022079918.1 ATP-dependent RNA helicase DDX42-like [Acanthaster planci]